MTRQHPREIRKAEIDCLQWERRRRRPRPPAQAGADFGSVNATGVILQLCKTIGLPSDARQPSSQPHHPSKQFSANGTCSSAASVMPKPLPVILGHPPTYPAAQRLRTLLNGDAPPRSRSQSGRSAEGGPWELRPPSSSLLPSTFSCRASSTRVPPLRRYHEPQERRGRAAWEERCSTARDD
jgi:hypothetical protein